MGGLFNGGTISTGATRIGALQIQTSSYGVAVPLVYGTNRIPDNLIDYADFTAIAHTSSQSSGGKGGGVTQENTTYTYTAAVAMGLCEGPIAGVGAIWAGKEQLNLYGLGATLFDGFDSQTAWGYMVTNHPGHDLSYRGVAYVAAPAYPLGTTASLPQHTFEVIGAITYGGTSDALPTNIITDYLTNAKHGAGFPAAKLGSMTAYTNYCLAAGLLFSPAYTSQTAAGKSLTELAQATNTGLVWSEGLLKFVPYGDTAISGTLGSFTPNITPVYDLTDDDFLGDAGSDPVIITRKSQADAYNQVQVEYLDRANQYNPGIATASDSANIDLHGLRPMQPLKMHFICDATKAQFVAQLILQRALYIRNTYVFKLGWKYALLECMDIVTITDAALGLSQTLVRITEIEESEDGDFSLIAEEMPNGIGHASLYPSQAGIGYQPNYNIAPPDSNIPIVFAPPMELTEGFLELWMAASGVAGWGGCNVWVSSDDATYKQVGTIHGSARMGVLSATLASGTDPDVTNVAHVDLTQSLGEMNSGTMQDADLLHTLCYVDGELVSYQSATLTAANKYDLGYLRRGVYNTTNGAHALGAKFARLDDAIFKLPYAIKDIGTTLYIKLQAFNDYQSGVQNLAAVTATSLVIPVPDAPLAVAGFVASVTNDGILLSWDALVNIGLLEYELRVGGANWAAATYVGKVRTTQLKVDPLPAGTTTWWIKAINTNQIESINATSTSLTVAGAAVPVVTQQVVDNNVLLYWTKPAGTQPIKTYEIRRGATYATAEVIGTKNGLFTTVFETVAGNFVYWVVAIDIADNYGTPGSVTATVNQPPDYALNADYISTLNGTLVNAVLSAGTVVLPVNTTETFAAHFTSHGWAGPSAQIAAGYPIFAQPAAASGSYEEVIDYGVTLAASKISVLIDSVVVSGAPGVTLTISTATAAAPTTWTDYVGVSSVYATNFRYIKIKIDVTAGLTDLLQILGINTRLDVKLKNDAGSIACNAADVGGTVVTFGQSFYAVTSITVSPQATGVVIPVYDFAGGPNPTTFKILLFNAAGTRVSGTASWSAKGY